MTVDKKTRTNLRLNSKTDRDCSNVGHESQQLGRDCDSFVTPGFQTGYMILASKLNKVSCSAELRGCNVCFVILIAFGNKRSTV
jgi:hypothetical protein